MWEIIKHSIPLCLQTSVNCSHFSELQNLQDKNPQVHLAMTLLMTYKVPKNYKIITSVKHKLICFHADKWCPKKPKLQLKGKYQTVFCYTMDVYCAHHLWFSAHQNQGVLSVTQPAFNVCSICSSAHISVLLYNWRLMRALSVHQHTSKQYTVSCQTHSCVLL